MRRLPTRERTMVPIVDTIQNKGVTIMSCHSGCIAPNCVKRTFRLSLPAIGLVVAGKPFPNNIIPLTLPSIQIWMNGPAYRSRIRSLNMWSFPTGARAHANNRFSRRIGRGVRAWTPFPTVTDTFGPMRFAIALRPLFPSRHSYFLRAAHCRLPVGGAVNGGKVRPVQDE